MSSVIIGARDERQLRDNLGAVGWRLDPEQIARLDAARAEAIKQVHVRVPLEHVGREDLERLRGVLTQHPGPCAAFLHLLKPDATETILALPDTIRVAASAEVLDAVERLLGAGVLSFR